MKAGKSEQASYQNPLPLRAMMMLSSGKSAARSSR
jgi:hypothetical protein